MGVAMKSYGAPAWPGNHARHWAQSKCHRQQKACGIGKHLAERAGFEPAEVLPSHDFQSCALGRTMLPLLDPAPRGASPLCHLCAPVPNPGALREVPWSSGATCRAVAPPSREAQSLPLQAQDACPSLVVLSGFGPVHYAPTARRLAPKD